MSSALRQYAQPSRRRWFRFSLRTFLLLITALCVALGLYAKRQRDRHLAIETIKRWGGVVDFADISATMTVNESFDRLKLQIEARQKGRPWPVFREQIPQNKHWQRKLFGKYYGTNVVAVTLRDFGSTPPGADNDVTILAPLTELRRLNLGMHIKDADLLQLPSLPQLRSLNLGSDTWISDQGLECLERLPNLTSLQIRNASITATGMAYIGAVGKIQSLMLNSCDVTDDSLANLAKLPHLTRLWLTDSTISDAGIVHLMGLRGLKYLSVRGTTVTEEGEQKLRAALPDCDF
jgi:Leucine Rich repeat